MTKVISDFDDLIITIYHDGLEEGSEEHDLLIKATAGDHQFSLV